jgi:hypothetical protein
MDDTSDPLTSYYLDQGNLQTLRDSQSNTDYAFRDLTAQAIAIALLALDNHLSALSG